MSFEKKNNRWKGPRGRGDSSGAADKPLGGGGAGIPGFVSGLSDSSRDQHRVNFLFVLHNLVGNAVVIKTKDGADIKGIFHVATPFDSSKATDFVVKMASVKGGQIKIQDGASVVISSDNILAIEVPELEFQAVKGSGITGDLQTDGDIGYRTKLGAAELQSLDGRELTGIDSSWLAPADRIESLEDPKGKKGGSTAWDQFEVNRRLYKVESSYDENLYTKPLNKNELTKDQIRMAEKYAREIESSRSNNIHLQEERGQAVEREMDEEDLYSGVIRPAPIANPRGPPLGKAVKNASSSVAANSGVDGKSWRNAVIRDSNAAPTQASQAPKHKSVSSPSPVAGKGGKTSKKTTGNADVSSPPPGYEDEFISVTPTSGIAAISNSDDQTPTTGRAKTPEPGETNEPNKSESPVISFFANQDEKPKSSSPSEKKQEEGDTKKAPDQSDSASNASAPIKSNLNPNAKEFVFNANAKAFSPKPAIASGPGTPFTVGAVPANTIGGGYAGPANHGGGRFNNSFPNAQRFETHQFQGGYVETGGYPYSPPWQYNDPAMMGGPIVPPVGDFYPNMGPYGMMGPGMMPGNMYPGPPHAMMSMPPGPGYLPPDASFGPRGPALQMPYGGRGGGRGGYQGRGGGNFYNNGQDQRHRSGSGEGSRNAPPEKKLEASPAAPEK